MKHYPAMVSLALLTGLTFALYWSGLGPDFIFDSIPSLPGNSAIHIDGATFEDWRLAASSFAGSQFGRPLTMLSFALDHVLLGSIDARWVRLFNVVLHCLVGWVVWGLSRAVLTSLPGLGLSPARIQLIALGSAALWLLHPLHVSTVLYSVQRMAQLSALFVLLGLWWFIHVRHRWARSGASPGEVSALGLQLLLLTGLAVLSKENGILLLGLVIAAEVSLFAGRWHGAYRPRLAWLAWFALAVPVLLVIVLLVSGAMPFLGSYSLREFDLTQRLLTETRVLWQYLGWIVLPNIQSMGLHHDDIPISVGLMQPMTTLFSVLAWALALVTALWWRSKFPLLLFALLFFLIGHSLESSFLPLELVWEHRNYLPSVAVLLLLAVLAEQVVRRLALQRRLLLALGLISLVTLSSLLLLRTQRWSDELLLARINVENHPASLRSQYHYANTVLRRGGQDPAQHGELIVASRHHYELMHQLDPIDISALISLYLVDSYYFPEFAERFDWLETIRQAATGEV